MMTNSGPRRGKLRTQVLVSVLTITLVALAVFDFAAVTALRTYLINETNATLNSVLTQTQPQLNVLLPAYRKQQIQAKRLPVFGEYYIAWVTVRGKVVDLQGGGAGGPKASVVSGLADISAAGSGPASAKLQAAKAQAPKAHATQVATTIVGASGFALKSVAVPGQEGTLVAGTDLKNVDETVDRVKGIVVIGSAAAAMLIFVGVSLVMRLGLRPIEAMAGQADRITAGDLTDRVGPDGGGSEVGRLGAALNGMLARIGASVAEREASQELMRRFFAEASHELRTPLASLRANAELYQQGALTKRSQVDEAMRRISLEAQRMSRLVDDMLRLARLDQHPGRQNDPVDIAAVVRDCTERARIADPARTWRARIEGDLVAVGDEELLGRAVDNLLTNVRAHTPEGTAAAITARDDGHHIVVEVSDNGPGVPADRLPRIFDRFYRAHSHHPGSGLGLAIVAEIAAAHEGTATAGLNYPQGLHVTLTLPAWHPANSPGSSGTATSDASGGSATATGQVATK
jgi:two-component system OmpR family sensor kinase